MLYFRYRDGKLGQAIFHSKKALELEAVKDQAKIKRNLIQAGALIKPNSPVLTVVK